MKSEHADRIELYVDGGSRGNPGLAASAYVIKSSTGQIVASKGFHLGVATNNVAEYTALLRGLDAVARLDVCEVDIFSDSELMVKQIIGEYKVRSEDLMKLFEQVQRKLLSFNRWQIKHIRREFNKDADCLVNETLDFGEDVDESDEGSTPEVVEKPAERPIRKSRAKSSPVKVAETRFDENLKVKEVKILAEIVDVSGEPVCKNPMQVGQCFVFSQCVPAGLCVHAAMSLLPIVLAMQNDPSASSQEVRCSRRGCGVRFKLSTI
jgi:uncharacterized repeat protein (TIGR04076 family)